jgi:hypothetical protein
MKKISLFITITILMSCSSLKESSTKNQAKKYSLYEKLKQGKIPLDSIHIITPEIEVKEKLGNSFINHPSKRDSLREFTIQAIESELINASYIKVPFMFQNYRTINKIIEVRLNTEKTIKAPKEIIIKSERYTIFPLVFGYYGDLNRGSVALYLIDNKDELCQLIYRRNFNYSPLNTKRVRILLLRGLKKLKSSN